MSITANKNGKHAAGVGETVNVFLKTPNGVILQLSREEPITEQTPSGPRSTTIYRKHGERFACRGTAVPHGTIPKFLEVGGFAVTSGVPRSFWEDWLRLHADMDLVRNGLIYALPDLADGEARAREFEKLRHGLEPVDPQNLPKGVTTADRR